MSAIQAIPIGVVVVSLIVTYVRYRATVPSPSADPANTEPPTFRIVAVGGSGSGKTVFLSSLFHSLNFRTPRRSYHLETDPGQRVLLGRLYREVSDTSEPWPAGTKAGETREFTFDCVATDEAESPHEILRMSYLDYAGELLETEQKDGGMALDDLAKRIAGADALLGMIDGYRVAQLLRDEPEGRSHFEQALRPMFGFMQSARCPIHLVITKWDLVRDFGEPADANDQDRLDRVIEALMQYEYIKSLVYVGSRRRIVRLIPVSAVGADFVELDADGEVVKRPGGRMRPTNVEVPLAAVLPDLFEQVRGSLDPALERRLERKLGQRFRRRPIGDVARRVLRGPVGAALRLATTAAFGRDLGTDALLLFIEWMSKPFERRRDRVIGGSRGEERLIERERLRRKVLDDFTRAVIRLEAVLPNSQLSHGW